MTSRICTINVRGGSKGLPGKNSAILQGLPLLVHSIRHAKESKLFDMILVSSDSPQLRALGAAEGVLAIERPNDLASDKAPKVPAIIHAVEAGEGVYGGPFETVVDLDVTSPLRKPQDIIDAVQMLESQKLKSVFSVCESHRSPYFNLVSKDDNGIWGPAIREGLTVARRQDARPTFDMNASIYVWNRSALLSEKSVFTTNSGVLVMPLERSWDIDTALDFEIVKFLMSRSNQQ